MSLSGDAVQDWGAEVDSGHGRTAEAIHRMDCRSIRLNHGTQRDFTKEML